MTSKNTISKWFDEGVENGYDKMIVFCDRYDYEDYPVYTFNESFTVIVTNHLHKNTMTKIMEVYDLKMDKEIQLKEYRARHFL